jgi:hypothetical protein
VFAYLAERIVAVKRELGIKPARGPTVLSVADRRRIEQRIAEYGAGDVDRGVEACRQVIEVDEADCRRNQEISSYWNASTPFRTDGTKINNFASRLDRWREDGEHVPFGARGSSKRSTARGTNQGWHAAMDDDDWASMVADLEVK